MGTETDVIRTQCDAIDVAAAAAAAELAARAAQLAIKDDEIAGLKAEIEALRNPPPAPVPEGPVDFYINPTMRGSGSGTSESDAAAIGSLSALANANPGKRFGILPGVYNRATPIDFSAGGLDKDHPTLIMALGTHDIVGSRNAGQQKFVMPAEGVIEGAWRSVTAPTWGSAGNELFRFLAGANWITIQGLHTSHHRYPYKLIGNVEGLRFLDLYSLNAEDHIYQKYGSGNGAKDMVVRGSQLLGYSKSAVRWNGESDGLLVENTVGDSGFQVSGEFAMGFFCNDNARNATFKHVTARRHLDVQSWNDGAYWNGDGFVAERGNVNIRCEDCLSELNSDGGFDLKAQGIYLLRCVGKNVKRSFRMWNHATLDACQSITPHKFAVNGRAGGSGAPCDLFVRGGADAAHPTVITLKGGTSLPQVIKDPVTAGGTWYGEIRVVP